MSEPVPLFVEICAGLASVSGVLQHGTHWKPPISRMGRKTGYAEAILRVMGLRPRQGAAHYLWAEADSDVAALLAAYTQPAVMRQIADIIRSWIPCPYGPHEGWCSRCKGTGRWDARDLWEVLRREKRRGLWDGEVGAMDTAAWSYLAWTHHEAGNLRGGFVDPEDGGRYGAARSDVATKYDRAALPWPPVHLTPDATIQPAQSPPGTVVYFDPPYAGTTGYKHDLPRAEVLDIAERWASDGARVYISEAEPLPIPGWHHVEIGGERKGQKRTFGDTQEWLTCSHPPAWTPPMQASLFGPRRSVV